MKNTAIGMNELQPGEKGTVCSIMEKSNMRRRFEDIGIVKGSTVECFGRSPGGDPAAYFIKSALIAIRDEDSKNILIHKIRQET